jgi:hypothetical protein
LEAEVPGNSYFHSALDACRAVALHIGGSTLNCFARHSSHVTHHFC